MKRNRSYPTLSHWRTEHDLTQVEAAKRLGITQGAYSKLENQAQGTRRAERIKRIAETTGVPLEVILGIA